MQNPAGATAPSVVLAVAQIVDNFQKNLAIDKFISDNRILQISLYPIVVEPARGEWPRSQTRLIVSLPWELHHGLARYVTRPLVSPASSIEEPPWVDVSVVVSAA